MEDVTARFSLRTGWDRSENAFAAAVRIVRAQASSTTRQLIDLTVSNPTLCGFSYDARAILPPLSTTESLAYDPDPVGIRSAREAVARYYAAHGAEIDPDALLLTTSTSEAYGYLFRLLCNPGDEVLVAQPSYPLFDFLADLQDVRLRPYPLFYDFGWWIDFAELERRIGPRTKAILVVHPNNPTGHWTSRFERDRLVQLCEQHHLALIVDEVFLDYPLAPSDEAISFASGEHPALTFVLSGMSKIAGLPQMKAAWLLTLGPAHLQQEALSRLEIIADTFLSMSAPVQHALPSWLDGRASIRGQIIDRITRNAYMASLHVPIQRIDAGWSLLIRTPLKAEDLLRDHAIIVHPGSFYRIAEKNRIVVSLLPPEPIFNEGISRIAEASKASHTTA